MAGKEFPLAIVIRTVDKATAGFDKVTKNLDRVGRKMANVGRLMTASLTLPIIGIGAASVKAFSSFEAGMANVGTLVDTSTVDMAALKKEVLALGRKTPVAVEDLTNGLYDLVSGGVAASDAMNVLERSTQLAVAGLSTTAEASSVVTSAMKSFGLEGEAANGIYDVLFTTVKNGKLTLSELKQGFGGGAKAASDQGVAFDEYSASVAALTTVGNTASESQNKIKAALSGLLRPTKELGKALTSEGVGTFEELIKKSGGMVPAFKILSESVHGSKKELLAMVGGAEALGAVTSLVGGQNEAFNATLTDMRDGAESVGEAFKKQAGTTAAQWQKTKNSLVSVGVSVGAVLAPALGKLAQKTQAVVSWFSDLDEGTKETIVKIAGLVAVVGPSLLVLGKMASALRMITGATKLLSKAMLMNPLALLFAGIEAISLLTGDSWATLFDDAIKFWREVFTDFFDWLEGKILYVTSAIDDAVAYFSGKETSNDKLDQESANLEIRHEFDQRLIKGHDKASSQAEKASDAAWAALVGRIPENFDATAPPLDAQKSHVMVEFQNPPDGMRVKSMKGSGKIDVTTGYQGA